MPIEERVLGLPSKWFRIALAQSKQITLEAITVPVITKTCFLATKLEAFKDRGNEDFYLSHDFEDIVALIDGAQNIVGDVANSELSLRRYVADGFAGLVKNSNLFDALPGHFPADSGGARRQLIIERMQEISRL